MVMVRLVMTTTIRSEKQAAKLGILDPTWGRGVPG